jgi:activator of HSP90 ATPase
VILPATSRALFETYLDPDSHKAVTGADVVIGAERGADFQAFDGMLRGTILAVIRPTLIVQSWRSVAFNAEDPDSTLVLTFTPEGNEGRIDIVHLDIPDHDYDGVNEGWDKYYWQPWRRYLESSKLNQPTHG